MSRGLSLQETDCTQEQAHIIKKRSTSCFSFTFSHIKRPCFFVPAFFLLPSLSAGRDLIRPLHMDPDFSLRLRCCCRYGTSSSFFSSASYSPIC